MKASIAIDNSKIQNQADLFVLVMEWVDQVKDVDFRVTDFWTIVTVKVNHENQELFADQMARLEMFF